MAASISRKQPQLDAQREGELENTPFGSNRTGNPTSIACDAFSFCADRIWALDSQQQPLLVIPAAQIISTISSESAGDWIVRVRWAEHSADFHYRGIFAEHLARVAESSLRSVVQPALPVIPKKTRRHRIMNAAIPTHKKSVDFRRLCQNIPMARGWGKAKT